LNENFNKSKLKENLKKAWLKMAIKIVRFWISTCFITECRMLLYEVQYCFVIMEKFKSFIKLGKIWNFSGNFFLRSISISIKIISCLVTSPALLRRRKKHIFMPLYFIFQRWMVAFESISRGIPSPINFS